MTAPDNTAMDALNDSNAGDDQVAAGFVSKLPAAVRIAGGIALRELVKGVIRRERERCQAVIVGGVMYHGAKKDEAEAALARTAITGASDREIEQIGQARVLAIHAMAVLNGASRMLMIAPGSCPNCNGTGQVASSVQLAGGQRAAMQCPACGGDGKAKAPAAGTTSGG